MTNYDDFPYKIVCAASGDVAFAEDLNGALAAAYSLVDDAPHLQGATGTHRRSLSIYKNGQYDGLATTLAQEGRR
jgi:hypothetical protein